MVVGAGLALLVLSGLGCNRNRQQAVKLAQEGDLAVDLDPTSAIAKYEQAVKLDPTNHLVLYRLAKAHKKKEEWDRAASVLARATEIAPTYASYWYERGYALEQQAKKKAISFEECKEPYKKCIEVDPNKDECYDRLANAYLWTDDEQKALTNLTKAVEFRPTRIDYYARLADLYIRLNYLKEAEGVLKAAKSMAKPTDEDLFGVHVLLADVYKDRGAFDEMVTELEAAKTVGGKDHPEILFNLGSTYAKLNPPRKAEALQMLKGFSARACRSKEATKYKDYCEQSQTLIQQLQGAGG
ncbi:MAG: tetratricopeptide repeat protein [Deltaproteobacteria bacterium]|nr:tetratricopeptide repeat protein [Deltaproteobacteria bacterium]